MPDGDILHPLNVDDVVHVPVFVYRLPGDGKPVAEYPICFRFCIAHGSNDDTHSHRVNDDQPETGLSPRHRVK